MNDSAKKNLFGISFLYLSQAISLLAPLVQIPLLISILGQGGYGQFSKSIVLGLALVSIIEFGFNQSGPRMLISNIDKPIDIVSNVLSAKIIISIFAFTFYILYSIILNSLEVFSVIIILSYIISSLSVNWYFLTVKSYSFVAIVDASLKLLTLALIFAAGRLQMSYLGIAICFMIPNILLFFLHYISIYKQSSKTKISIRKGWLTIKSSFGLFISKFGPSIYTYGGGVVAANFLKPDQFAVFFLLDRIAKNSTSIFNPLNQIAYPEVVKGWSLRKSSKDAKLYSIAISSIGFLLTIVLMVFGQTIVRFLSNGTIVLNSINSTEYYIATIYPAVIGLNLSIGIYFLIARQKENEYNKVIGFSALLFAVLCVPIIKGMGILGAISLMVAVECVNLFGFFLALFRYRNMGIR